MGNGQVRGHDERQHTFCQQLCSRLVSMTARGGHAAIDLLVIGNGWPAMTWLLPPHWSSVVTASAASFVNKVAAAA